MWLYVWCFYDGEEGDEFEFVKFVDVLIECCCVVGCE